MIRPTMRSALIAGALLVFLACAGVAQAHNVTSATLGCIPGGPGTQLTVNYNNFTPVNGQRETITATFTNGTVVKFVPPQDQSPPALVEAGPVVPNGTMLGVKLTWPEGSFTVPPVLVSCQTTPPPLTCTPPATPQNGVCVTPPPPVTPPTPPPPPPPPAATPPAPPLPPQASLPPRHHKHHHPKPHVVKITLGVTYLNQDPQPVRTALARRGDRAPFGCRIVGPSSLVQHGLVHFRVRCRSAKVLPGWKWSIDGRLVRNEHWTYTSNHGRSLNSWLFDRLVWTNPVVYGHYSIRATGRVRV